MTLFRKNIWIIGLVVMNVVFFSSCPVTDETDEANEYDIVMIGDSITCLGNWNILLKTKKVANLGISGDTTDGVFNRFGHVYLLEPKICFIMIGINDFTLLNRSVEDVMINYRKIATEVKNHEVRVIIQSVLYLGEKYYTNPYINSIMGHYKDDWIIINEKVQILNEKLEEMALEFDIEFLDLNDELSVNNVLSEEYEDEFGLHLNIPGYKKWAEIINQYIKKSPLTRL